MNYKEKIFEMIKQNNGHVTTKEIVQRGINRFFLTQMVKDGTILRYSNNIFLNFIFNIYAFLTIQVSFA